MYIISSAYINHDPSTNPHHHEGLPRIQVSQTTQDLNDDGLRFLWLLIDISAHHDFLTKPAWKILIADKNKGPFEWHLKSSLVNLVSGKPNKRNGTCFWATLTKKNGLWYASKCTLPYHDPRHFRWHFRINRIWKEWNSISWLFCPLANVFFVVPFCGEFAWL